MQIIKKESVMKKLLCMMLAIALIAWSVGAEIVSRFTDVDIESLHGNIRFNKQNPADDQYYPLRINIDGSAISDDGIRRNDRELVYVGTSQADEFTTAKQIYNACPGWAKSVLKDLGIKLINVDLSE